MKWYVIRWVTVLMLVGNPIKFAHAQGTEGKPFSAAYVIAMPVSHDSDTYMLSMRHWRMTVYICGAYLGREIVQRRKWHDVEGSCSAGRNIGASRDRLFRQDHGLIVNVLLDLCPVHEQR